MVKDREDNKSVRFNRIMDRVGKPFEQRAAQTRPDGAKTLGLAAMRERI